MAKLEKLYIIENESTNKKECIQNEFSNGYNYTTRKLANKNNDINEYINLRNLDLNSIKCLIQKNNMVIRTDEIAKNLVIYLPQKITDRQLEWLYKNSYIFDNYNNILAYSLNIGKLDMIKGYDNIFKEILKKNNEYHKTFSKEKRITIVPKNIKDGIVLKEFNGEGHHIIKEFMDKYNIWYEFLSNNDRRTPFLIFQKGHLVIQENMTNSSIEFYLPNQITLEQLNFILNNSYIFKEYENVKTYSLEFGISTDQNKRIDFSNYEDTYSEILRKHQKVKK